MRRTPTSTLGAALAGCLAATGCGSPPTSDDVATDPCEAPDAWFVCTRPLNMAHRGGSRLAPENTLAAFDNATRLGVDVLELDVHSSADGAVVVVHDDTVDRTTDGTGAVVEHTLAELQALDAGARFSPDGGATFPYRGQGVHIPTLDAVLDAFPEAHFSIEIKQQEPSIVDDVIDLLRAHDATHRVVVASFLDPVMADLRSKAPELLTTFTLGEMFRWSTLTVADDATWEPPAPVIQANVDTMTDDMLGLAKRHALLVQVWTVNDRATMDRLLAAGVDGILTDDPATLADAIDFAAVATSLSR